MNKEESKFKEVRNVNKPGSHYAARDYGAVPNSKLETSVDRKRKQGSTEADKKYEGSKKSSNDKTDQKRKKESSGFSAAEGAEKEYIAFRNKIREKLGLSNKGNTGELH